MVQDYKWGWWISLDNMQLILQCGHKKTFLLQERIPWTTTTYQVMMLSELWIMSGRENWKPSFFCVKKNCHYWQVLHQQGKLQHGLHRRQRWERSLRWNKRSKLGAQMFPRNNERRKISSFPLTEKNYCCLRRKWGKIYCLLSILATTSPPTPHISLNGKKNEMKI